MGNILFAHNKYAIRPICGLSAENTDLAAPIIEEIKKTFALTEDHTLDSFKLPFSDSSIYKHAI